MLWLLLLNDAMLLAATVPLAETLDAVADAKREEIAAAPERAAELVMVRLALVAPWLAAAASHLYLGIRRAWLDRGSSLSYSEEAE